MYFDNSKSTSESCRKKYWWPRVYRIKQSNATFLKYALILVGVYWRSQVKFVWTQLFSNHSWFRKDPRETKTFEKKLWKFHYYRNCPAIFYKIFPVLFYNKQKNNERKKQTKTMHQLFVVHVCVVEST